MPELRNKFIVIQSNLHIPFVDGLSAIEAQLQESDYREQLYYLLSDDGIHRLLVVNNPQRKTIKIGFMSIGMRVIVGHHGDFPENWMEQKNNSSIQKKSKVSCILQGHIMEKQSLKYLVIDYVNVLLFLFISRSMPLNVM